MLSITDAAGNMSEIEYDLAGRQIKATDANGSTAETVYDELDRAIIPKTPFEGTQKAVSKQYYDSNSNTVKKMVQNNVQGEAESYAVTDNMGNLLGEIGRNAGQDSVVQYTYDTGDA